MLIILRGPAASGKDTYARHLRETDPSIVIVNRDDLRIALHRTAFGPPIDEDYVSEVEQAAIKNALKRGFNVVSSNTNLHPSIANKLAWIAYAEGKDVMLVDHFKEVPLETLLERDLGRERHVPPAEIAKQWQRAQKKYTLPEKPVMPEMYHGTPGMPDVVLCDLDGTAALLGDRSPYVKDMYHVDTPNEAVRHILWGLHDQGTAILYVSARVNAARQATIDWLSKHNFPAGRDLIMRKDGDQRKDWVVKNELFDNLIAPNYNVLFCLDDRNQVVDAYRKRGLAVMQVADGNF